jgi:hypothetical protein
MKSAIAMGIATICLVVIFIFGLSFFGDPTPGFVIFVTFAKHSLMQRL